VFVIAGRSLTACHGIFKIFHRDFVNIYRQCFNSPARNVDLKPMSSLHIMTSILVDDSFFLVKLLFLFQKYKYVSSFIYFFRINDSYFTYRKSLFLSFSLGPHATLIRPCESASNYLIPKQQIVFVLINS